MPSDKRARKRAARDARQAALQRQQRRRATTRRTITLIVVAVLAAGVYALVSGGGKAKTTSAATTTTTTTTTTTPGGTPVPSTTTTVSLAGDTTSANCPKTFTSPLKKPTFSKPPPLIIDPTRTYSAVVTTDVGIFTMSLDTQAAPHTVNNFVFLAENHFFDCVTFHRVIPGFMDQTGDPTGTGSGGPGYQFANENVPTGGYTAGDVAMANAGANTNGSQFFVLVAPYSNDNYSLFGHVTSGMSVIQKINADGDASDNGSPPKVFHRIISVIINGSTG